MTKPIHSKWCPTAGAFALNGNVYVERHDGKHNSAQCVYWDGVKCSISEMCSCKSGEPRTLTEE